MASKACATLVDSAREVVGAAKATALSAATVTVKALEIVSIVE